jgi:hypothetical protein
MPKGGGRAIQKTLKAAAMIKRLGVRRHIGRDQHAASHLLSAKQGDKAIIVGKRDRTVKSQNGWRRIAHRRARQCFDLDTQRVKGEIAATRGIDKAVTGSQKALRTVHTHDPAHKFFSTHIRAHGQGHAALIVKLQALRERAIIIKYRFARFSADAKRQQQYRSKGQDKKYQKPFHLYLPCFHAFILSYLLKKNKG